MDIRNLQRKEKVDRRLLQRAAEAALEEAGAEGDCSFAVVGDEAMAEMNRSFTGREGPTDVLAFPMADEGFLGEVVISADACRRQARARGASFDDEMAVLAVHGVLHLAGYDHTRGPVESRRMKLAQQKAVKTLALGKKRR